MLLYFKIVTIVVSCTRVFFFKKLPEIDVVDFWNNFEWSYDTDDDDDNDDWKLELPFM